jgi:hypothetical protein
MTIYDPNILVVKSWDQAEGHLKEGRRVALDLTELTPAEARLVMPTITAGIQEHCALAFKPKGLRKYWLHPQLRRR